MCGQAEHSQASAAGQIAKWATATKVTK